MRKDIALPALALAGGCLGFGLRWWQLDTAYDPVTLLFAHGAPATYALLGLTALLALVFCILSRGGKETADFPDAFRCPAAGYMAAMSASAFLFLGAGVLGLLRGLEELSLWRADPANHLFTYPAALLLCALLSFAAGLAQLQLGKGAYRGQPAPVCSLLALFPASAGLVYLFATHLVHGTDPVLMSYGFTLAAAALLMLAHYYVAAFFHGRPHPHRYLFCALLGAVLGLVSLADRPSPFDAAILAAFTLSALAGCFALLRNTFGPPWPRRLLEERMPSGAQEDGKPDGHDDQPEEKEF